jgi:hypothetical protein
MKKMILFVAISVLFVACSEKSESEKRQVVPSTTANTSVEAYGTEQEPSATGAPSKPGTLYAPPKPATKGLYDFSECKAKHPEGSEAYKDCVKAKYPNLKMAGEEKVDPDIEMKIKKEMEKEAFKNLKKEQDRFNDSLARLGKRTGPRQPGPEGVLRNLMIMCKERGDCPHE